MIREHLCGLTRGELVTWGASGVDLHVKPYLAYPQITTPFWPKAPLYIHICIYKSSSGQIRDPLWVISKSGLTLVSTPLAPLVTLLKNCHYGSKSSDFYKAHWNGFPGGSVSISIYWPPQCWLLRLLISHRGTPQITNLSQSQTFMYWPGRATWKIVSFIFLLAQ